MVASYRSYFDTAEPGRTRTSRPDNLQFQRCSKDAAFPTFSRLNSPHGGLPQLCPRSQCRAVPQLHPESKRQYQKHTRTIYKASHSRGVVLPGCRSEHPGSLGSPGYLFGMLLGHHMRQPGETGSAGVGTVLRGAIEDKPSLGTDIPARNWPQECTKSEWLPSTTRCR
jgi:hypothetical protein